MDNKPGIMSTSISKHPNDDKAVEAAHLAQAGEAAEFDEARVRKLIWKIDMRLLPVICVTYALQGVDKTTLGYAAVYGMREDLGLSGTDYSWAGAIFYLGYLAWEFPTNVLLQRFNISHTMSATVILWGMILMCSAAAQNVGGILVTRFLLGALESSINPGTMLLYSMYYQRHEQPFRMGVMVGAAGAGYVISGIASYGIGHLHTSIASWRLLFLFWGAITVVWGVFQLLALPGSPLTAKFLTDEERQIVILRVQQNGTGVENSQFKWVQFREALLDTKTWLLFLLNISINAPNGGLQAFQGLIIEGLGFSKLETSLIQMPSGGVQLVVCPLACLAIYRFRNARIITMALFLIPFFVGTIGTWTVSDTKPYARLVCLWITFTYNAAWTLSLSVATANTAGHTKKISTNAIMLIGYCIGNFIGPFFFKSQQAPRYSLGIGMMLFCVGVQYTTLAGLFFTMWARNRSRRLLHEQEVVPVTSQEAYRRGLLDETDKENKYFKYVY